MRFIGVSGWLFGCILMFFCPVAPAGEITDNENFRWDIQQDGSIGDGNNDTFDGGSHLILNGQRFPGGQQAAGADGREVVIGPQNMAGINITRKIRVSEKMPGCRFLEILENPSPQPVQVQVSLYTNVGASVQNTVMPDGKDGRVPYVVVDQGQGGARCLAYCMASSRGKLLVQAQARGDDITLVYDPLVLKPNERIAILHVLAQRNSVAEAEEYAKKMDWAAVLRELDRHDRALVRNVRMGGGLLSVGGVELFRGEGGDAVRLKSGELMTGSLETTAFQLETEFGRRDVPAGQVLSLFSSGDQVRLVCQNGEVLTGRPVDSAIKLKLKGGRDLDIPLAVIGKYGKRMPRPKNAEEDGKEPEASVAEQFSFTDPVFVLRNGDRLVGKLQADKLAVNTLYGAVSVSFAELKRVEFPHAELRSPVIFLKDGSAFAALPVARQFVVKPGTGAPVTLDAGRLSAMLFTPAEDLAEAQDDSDAAAKVDAPSLPAPHGQLHLLNQDLFCGTLSGTEGKVELETPFGKQVLGVDQIMRLKPRKAGAYNVRVSLWDGNVFPARWPGDLIAFTANGGSRLEVPLGLLNLYWRPLALPPADESGRIEALIAQLGDNDPQTRETAQKALLEKGHGTRALLARHWNAEDLEKRTRVRRILDQLQENAPQETLEDEEDEGSGE